MSVTIKRQTVEAPDLRDRKRVSAMRRVQAAALDLFEHRPGGYAAVTIEEIAAAAEVGAATVYRHFGGKERIILWDEYDLDLFAEITRQLVTSKPKLAPLHAVHRALVIALDRVYAEDKDRILRRSRLMAGTPALALAASADMIAMRYGLAQLFLKTRSCPDTLEANVLSGAIIATLDSAIIAWVADRGRVQLRKVIGMAFRKLERVTRTS